MAKAPKTAYVCNDCGAEFSRWQGQCSACKAWNTISEVRGITSSQRGGPRRPSRSACRRPAGPSWGQEARRRRAPSGYSPDSDHLRDGSLRRGYRSRRWGRGASPSSRWSSYQLRAYRRPYRP